jgi:prepilin-type processing-associated H-X9-DG protein
LNANAYYADGHVTFTRYDELENIGAILPSPSAQCFVTPQWSLFPLKLKPEFLTDAVMQVCKPR